MKQTQERRRLSVLPCRPPDPASAGPHPAGSDTLRTLLRLPAWPKGQAAGNGHTVGGVLTHAHRSEDGGRRTPGRGPPEEDPQKRIPRRGPGRCQQRAQPPEAPLGPPPLTGPRPQRGCPLGASCHLGGGIRDLGLTAQGVSRAYMLQVVGRAGREAVRGGDASPPSGQETTREDPISQIRQLRPREAR